MRKELFISMVNYSCILKKGKIEVCTIMYCFLYIRLRVVRGYMQQLVMLYKKRSLEINVKLCKLRSACTLPRQEVR